MIDLHADSADHLSGLKSQHQFFWIFTHYYNKDRTSVLARWTNKYLCKNCSYPRHPLYRTTFKSLKPTLYLIESMYMLPSSVIYRVILKILQKPIPSHEHVY